MIRVYGGISKNRLPMRKHTKNIIFGGDIMKNITRPGSLHKYYMYKGHFITRDRDSGIYSMYTEKGRLMAATQKGIKKLINEYFNLEV